jgi:transcriptional regulator with XRE-family HTH domain
MIEVSQEALARNVFKARKRAELSQEALAVAASVNRRQVQRIEREQVDARISTVAKIAYALDLSPEHLVKGVKVIDDDEDSNHVAEPGAAS